MKLKSIATVAALAVAAGGALAEDLNMTVDLVPSGANMFTGAFSAIHRESGAFLDSFVFNLPPLASALGSGTVTFTSLSGPISLVQAVVASADGGFVGQTDTFASLAIPSSFSFMNATAPLTLLVQGFAGGGAIDPFDDPVPLTTSYAGNITFNNAVAAIPEPETYALMLAGLAGVGYAARRRKEKAAMPAA